MFTRSNKYVRGVSPLVPVFDYEDNRQKHRPAERSDTGRIRRDALSKADDVPRSSNQTTEPNKA